MHMHSISTTARLSDAEVSRLRAKTTELNILLGFLAGAADTANAHKALMHLDDIVKTARDAFMQIEQG